MQIRLAKIDDIEALVKLRLAMQREVNSEVAMPAEFESTVLAYLARALADGSYVSIVAEENGELVGTTGVVFYDKLPSLSGKLGRNAHVSNVFTIPEYRGRGIATGMMRALVEHCRECEVDVIQLTATEDGRRVYERVGFIPPRHPALELRLSRNASTYRYVEESL